MIHCKKVLFLSVLAVAVAQSVQSPVGSMPQDDNENLDLNVDLSCIANATCINNVSNKVVRALNMKKLIDFGAFTIEPLKNAKKTEGRAMSKFTDLISGNAVRVPLGAYSLSLQKSEEYDNYLEVAVSKTVEGKYRSETTAAFNRSKINFHKAIQRFSQRKEKKIILEVCFSRKSFSRTID